MGRAERDGRARAGGEDWLSRAVDEDTEAFNRVMEAMRLPKGTPDQQAERARAIDAANRAAAEVPLQTARLCLETIALAEKAAELGNRNSASDAGVAALAARAGAEGAALNVRINLAGIADAGFKARASEEVAAIETDARRRCEAVLARVAATIKYRLELHPDGALAHRLVFDEAAPLLASSLRRGGSWAIRYSNSSRNRSMEIPRWPRAWPSRADSWKSSRFNRIM